MHASFDGAVAFARDLIRIPGLPGQEGEVAARVVLELQALGFNDVWTDEVGNCFGRVRGRGDAPVVMLNCHLDCVDVGDAAAWEHPPFGADLADGFLHGRGAMDIKGPLALQTHAAATFLQQPLDGDVIVAHTVLEERGGWGMEHLLQKGEVRPAAVIIGEATNGDVCIGHRGRAELIVEIQGVAAHASAPERAHNPIALLPAVLPVLQRFAERLPSDPMLGKSTMAPTAIETLPRSRNVIPDRVRIILDWRLLPGLTPDDAVHRLRTTLQSEVEVPAAYSIDVRFATELQTAYTGRERERRMFTPGFLIDSGHAVIQAAVRAVTAGAGRAPRLRPWTFATDGGHACGVHGIPCFGYAPGDEAFAHTNRERLPLDQARQTYETMPELVRTVQQALR